MRQAQRSFSPRESLVRVILNVKLIKHGHIKRKLGNLMQAPGT